MNARSRVASVVLLCVATVSGASSTSAQDTFSKVGNGGQTIDATRPLGTGEQDWACTRDARSGLMWEVKTRDGGLRDRRSTYTPFDSNPDTNGGWEGYRDQRSGQCARAVLPGESCNTEAYVVAVNSSRLCGFDDWRLPTTSELIAVAHATSRDAPENTASLLPNTADGWYWTGVERVGVAAFSRVVLLPSAGRPDFYDGSYMVLVVRDAKKETAGQ